MRDDRVQMLQIRDLDVDEHLAGVGRNRSDNDVVDISSVIANDSCDLPQSAWLIDGNGAQPRGEELVPAFLNVPAHIDPALRLVIELPEIGRLDWINGDSLAGREDADNAVAGDRAAIRRKADGEIRVRAADRNGGLVRVPCFGKLKDEARCFFETEPACFAARAGNGRLALVEEFGINGAHDIARKHFAASDGGKQIFNSRAREPRQGSL